MGMAFGEGIYQTSANICHRCALSDEQYEEVFGAPKEIVPDFVGKDADTNRCEFHDEAPGKTFLL
ncbi:MAG: hypothetical protein U5L95_02650 [Candidatus Saccharibacteria bacterium]|nr:hypothetical protein [Candidatus Saccharibacteria bacterium]